MEEPVPCLLSDGPTARRSDVEPLRTRPSMVTRFDMRHRAAAGIAMTLGGADDVIALHWTGLD